MVIHYNYIYILKDKYIEVIRPKSSLSLPYIIFTNSSKLWYLCNDSISRVLINKINKIKYVYENIETSFKVKSIIFSTLLSKYPICLSISKKNKEGHKKFSTLSLHLLFVREYVRVFNHNDYSVENLLYIYIITKDI